MIIKFNIKIRFFCVSILIVNLLFSQPTSQKSFIINGSFIGKDNGFVILSYIDFRGKAKIDTAKIIKGNFKFFGKLKNPVNAIFRDISSSNWVGDSNVTNIFLEPTIMKVVVKLGDFKKASILGSISQDETQILFSIQQPILNRIDSLQNEITLQEAAFKADTSNPAKKYKISKTREYFREALDTLTKIELTYIFSHPNSYLSAYLLQLNSRKTSFDTLKSAFLNLRQNVKNSTYGQDISEFIEIKEMSSVGGIAPNFASKELTGTQISLSGFKGKNYVLLDFWGSWCKPCRENNPVLIKLYNKYHSKGLEIVGIAHDDKSPDLWRKAIQDDGIGIWHHVLRGFDMKKLSLGEPNENDIGYKYAIYSFPTEILIDKSGKIIGRYNGDEFVKLKEQLARIFEK